jgi:mRNA interferase MazF
MKQVFYVPERGDIVWVSLELKPGQGQAERRRAIVLSPQAYNLRVGLAILCPITSQVKAYPFEVPIPADLSVGGAILSDQVESLDWRVHRAELICALPSAVVDEVLGKLRALLG